MVNKNYIKTLVNGLLKKIESHRSDWNVNDENAEGYVKNRTHWTENNVKQYMVKDKVVTFTEQTTDKNDGTTVSAYSAQNPFLFSERLPTATITWDGVDYNCKEFMTEAYSFGNGILLTKVMSSVTEEDLNNDGIYDTGEPFLIVYIENDITMIVTESTEATHTISISTIGDLVHKLDNKYMSKEVNAHITDKVIHITDDERMDWNYALRHANTSNIHVTSTDKTNWNNTKTNLSTHTGNSNIHVTSTDKTNWNNTKTNLSTHTGNSNIHVTSTDKTNWNNGSSNNVKFTTQSLTDANKLQARKNIGANKTYQKITLYSSSWNSSTKQQTVTVTGVLADETKQEITPMPAIASQSAYYEAGIMCTNQATNKLTFTADEIPTTNLTVYVTIQGVDAV